MKRCWLIRFMQLFYGCSPISEWGCNLGCVTFSQLEQFGRLGNQLFQIAAVIGEADRLGFNPIINPNWSYRRFFSLPDDLYGCVQADDVVVDLAGYFQDLRYFERVLDQVLAWFKPSELSLQLQRDLFLGFSPNVLAMHVRRGDYTQLQHAFKLVGRSYYEQASRHIIDQAVSIDDVLIFSDDPKVAELELGDLGRVVTLSHENLDILTLQFMSSCPAIAIANSTFSWWSAFLSQAKYVFYPSIWGVNGFDFQDRVNTIIPKSWIQMVESQLD